MLSSKLAYSGTSNTIRDQYIYHIYNQVPVAGCFGPPDCDILGPGSWGHILNYQYWAYPDVPENTGFENEFLHEKSNLSMKLDETFKRHINFLMRFSWNGSQIFVN